MRTLVIGDIHGGYRALEQVLDKAKVTVQDKLIFLGDYVDGWSESPQTIDKLISLSEKQECIFILGNHDLWCKLWLTEGKSNPIWLAHGGKETIDSYIKTGLITSKKHLNFFESLKNYYIDFNQRLFIHAGFTSMHGVTREEYQSNYYWDRTLLETALLAEELPSKKIENKMPQRFTHYKEIYIGHTPTTNYKINEPIFAYNLINVDTGAAFKGKLTILDIDSKEFWQSDVLTKLYPNEKGRN
ncbi:metallophosphoesterase family protein [Polaribacter porphyrae]|uniref:Serine/threonine protein phosphatase n=1 Tax=Polaribacter porphyrae TaxID=1137780 RepID=A0A2S7WNY4_9FLAO|nr:metallophosphoesterase family protein [Polaribacter porphyrae]PQJ79022.1 serine/threonine protein phosphatase [Polaribacter porphyrae]